MNMPPDPAYLARPIYLDGHASTPCSAEVLSAMLPYFTSEFGNPSSTTHKYGNTANSAVRQARQSVAELVGTQPGELTFLSSATEGCNLVLKGGNWRRIVTLATEHKAVLAACETLQKSGVTVDILPVQPDGLLDLAALAGALNEPTDLVAVMGANNEIGVIQPLAAISELCHTAGALFFVDATQLVPWKKLDIPELGVDFAVFSAHKMHGPKGAAAMYAAPRARRRLKRQMDGGGQEAGLRGGTLNVPAIVGFGVAAEEALERYQGAGRVSELRDQLLAGLVAAIPDLKLHGTLQARLPNNLCVSVPNVESDVLLAQLPDLALSAGSACYSGAPEPSYVVRALGVPYGDAWSAFRIGLLHSATLEEVEYATRRIAAEAMRLRGSSAAEQAASPHHHLHGAV